MSFIAQCEQEQLHLSGAIQPHGALIVVTLEGKVSHYSENIQQLQVTKEKLIIGERMPSKLAALLDDIPDKIGVHDTTQTLAENGEVFYVVRCRSESAISLEFYPALAIDDAVSLNADFKLPRNFKDKLDLEHYREKLLEFVAKLTGHDRIMYYQFVSDGDGIVTAEVCSDETDGTYLDLRFPASDIPKIARNLYMKNPWREIPQAQAEAINVVGEQARPDLTYVDLRSVSPVHQLYMKNMRVDSSISFPIIKGNKLDALIACHSKHPKFIARENLNRIASIVSSFTLLLRELDSRKNLDTIDQFNIQTEHLRYLLANDMSLDDKWDELAKIIKDQFAAETMVLFTPSNIYSYGKPIDIDIISKIDRWYNIENPSLVFQTDNLRSHIPSLPLTDIAGMAALKFGIKINSAEAIRVYLTRSESLYQVEWGGNPNKPKEINTGDIAISPRQSFSKWVEKRLGYSEPWASHTELELHRLRDVLEWSHTFQGLNE